MSDDEEESILSLSTLLFAVVTLAVYILFLRPTPTVRNNNGNGTTATAATTPTTATAARTTAVQQRRANALAGANANANAIARRQQQHQQQQQNNNNTTLATIQQRRPPVLSENAIEVLKNCKAYPPHVEPRSIKSNSNSNSIGCYNLLSDSGLISFNYLKAASAASAAAAATANNSNNNTKNSPIDLTKKTATTNTNANNNNSNNNKIQRQERAKILSRLFANSSTVATPPMKGSTFIIGVSYNEQLQKKEHKLSITRVIKGLATYYNVLVIVAVDNDNDDDNSNSNNHHRYESTQKLHEQVVQTLRSSSSGGDEEGVGDGGEKKDDSLVLLSESILPSHRILLSKSAVGRIALVRQLSSNIGLTIDFNPEVKIQLEKFGYNVSIIKNWYETFPSPSV